MGMGTSMSMIFENSYGCEYNSTCLEAAPLSSIGQRKIQKKKMMSFIPTNFSLGTSLKKEGHIMVINLHSGNIEDWIFTAKK